MWVNIASVSAPKAPQSCTRMWKPARVSHSSAKYLACAHEGVNAVHTMHPAFPPEPRTVCAHAPPQRRCRLYTRGWRRSRRACQCPRELGTTPCCVGVAPPCCSRSNTARCPPTRQPPPPAPGRTRTRLVPRHQAACAVRPPPALLHPAHRRRLSPPPPPRPPPPPARDRSGSSPQAGHGPHGRRWTRWSPTRSGRLRALSMPRAEQARPRVRLPSQTAPVVA